jgi:diguanylate cyclase (GGDEF)-like protein
LITTPLAAFAFACVIVFAVLDATNHAANHHPWYQHWPGGLAALGAFVVAQIAVLNLLIRRQASPIMVTEIPLVLALFYLPPLMVVVTFTLGALINQVRTRMDPVKLCFNVAKSAAQSSAALLVLAALPPIRGVGPGTWGILLAACLTSALVAHCSVAAVMMLLQGRSAGPEAVRSTPVIVGPSTISIAIGVLFLIAMETTPWAVLLAALLVLAMVLLFRSFAGFFRQYRTLTDVYELTLALREHSSDGGLPDALLGRVRRVMRAEYATLWLPAQGRHPEVLLTARVDDAGLLDISPTPSEIRERALAGQSAVAVGSQFDETADLRPTLRTAGRKDVIVVPLRSGQTTVGSLEVVNRMGDSLHFRAADVQVLETIAAHAAVAVENSRLVDRLRYDAYHDRLTSLPNRRRITDALAESVKVRAPGEVVAVMLFDVDGLRDVNESMGHSVGDKLLAEVAERLRGIAGPGALVGRIGGDEFVVTLRAESTEASVQLATQMREQLRGPMTVGSLTLDVDTAVGVSVHPDHSDEPDALLRRAELAANSAKVVPYGVQLFHPALDSRAVRRLGLAADLRRALDAGQLEVYFQPKVNISDRHLVGVECLARWQHPAHGEVVPEDFIAVAEHTGQLHRLTEVVLAEGLRRCRQWADADRPLSIAVNLSARTLLDSRFPDLVHQMLKQYRVPAPHVTFEISEPGMLGDIERALPTMFRLRDLGVRLSVDDFGTGASSLSYLRQLPVHEVKIDDSFVQGMATDSGDLAIVRAVVGLAREFGLTVVAEGVESEMTLELLEEMGCGIGQGYLFSRPLPYERLEAWFNAQTEPESTPTGEVRRLRAVV